MLAQKALEAGGLGYGVWGMGSGVRAMGSGGTGLWGYGGMFPKAKRCILMQSQ